jgi:preprotein translocase subunit SecG
MEWLQTALMVVQVCSALAIILLVLLQQGKGADMGAAFGSGASGSVFGASGSANFLSRATAVLAFVFFAATIAITWIGNKKPADAGVLSGTTAPAATGANPPVAPAQDPSKPAVPK